MTKAQSAERESRDVSFRWIFVFRCFLGHLDDLEVVVGGFTNGGSAAVLNAPYPEGVGPIPRKVITVPLTQQSKSTSAFEPKSRIQ